MRLWHTRLLAILLGLYSAIGMQSAFASAFDPPPNQDAPRSTAGGGSRPTASSCLWQGAPGSRAIALAPQNFVGLSTQDQPALWIHIPPADIHGLELSLFDERLNGLAQQQVELPQTAGFYRIPFPETVRLVQGQTYYWAVALICHPSRRTEDWVVGGWIRYQPLLSNASSEDSNDGDLSTRQPRLHRSGNGQPASPVGPEGSPNISIEQFTAQVNHYMETGYWYDALTTLLPLIQEKSSSLFTSTWVDLLQQANLSLIEINLNDSAQTTDE